MADWKSTSIGELFELHPGFAFKSEDFLEAGIPVIKIKNIKAGYFSDHDFSYVSPNFLISRRNKLAAFNDLLISMSGNRHDGSPETWVGKVAHFRRQEHYFVNQRVGALRPKPGARVDVRFAGFLLSSSPYQELFISIATSSGGQANLSPLQILSAPFRYPEYETQIAIGETLGALDDKIELNRRMNETLEATAQAIFKDWFVDFGPTRCKQEGGTPYLAPDIWSLFPDYFDDEGKPYGWSRVELESVTSELRRGISPSYVEFGGVRVLNQKCIRNRQVDPHFSRRHDPGKRAVDGRQLLVGDILVNSTGVGTLGRTAQIWEVDEPTVVDSHVTVVRADGNKVSACYLGLDLMGREAEIEALGEGSTGQTELARTRLSKLPLLLPPLPLQSKFQRTVQPLSDRITANARERRTLAITLHFLLPKLLSGEVRVKDAEKILGDAT
jgi:type I restriction enzyme S subunit